MPGAVACGTHMELGKVSANLEKINKYDKAGIKVCHNLILTMESDLDPLDVSEIRSKIEEYLL